MGFCPCCLPSATAKLVTESDLSGITGVLVLSDAGITALQDRDFSGLTSLQSILLSKNALSSLPPNVFAGLTRLQSLHLFDNTLTALPPNVFAGLANLQSLILYGNVLSALPPAVFAGLANLQTLHLFDNTLTSLPPNVFAGLAKLQALRLDGNTLSALPVGLFAGLANLQRLVLYKNALSSLPVGVFAGLTNLQYLALFRNALSSLPAGVFAGLSKLQSLALFDNKLSSLPAGLFESLSNLQELNLWENSLSELPADVFAGLTNLRKLFLHENALSSLPAGLFEGLSNLQELYLRENSLSELPADVFVGLTSLDLVNLSGNPGAPFTLTVELEQQGADAVVVKVAEGVPFDLTVTLSAQGGTLSAGSVTVAAGSLSSAPVTVSTNGTAPTPVTITMSAAAFPEDITHIGLTLAVGQSLTMTVTRATQLSLESTSWTTFTTGQITTAGEVDYFELTVPHAGVLVVETTGPTDTVGTVWQAGEKLAMADTGGAESNFRLSVRVAAEPVVIAVAGQGSRTGAYTLETYLVVGYLEVPGPGSFQSGIGVLSGWVCEADVVELEIRGLGRTRHLEAAYGTARADTAYTEEGAVVCGDTDNGFGVLFNWNLLGDGEHTVVAYVDGVELGRATVTVTTVGEGEEAEFLQGVEGECVVADFPMSGETARLVWQQNSQNFVIAGEHAPSGDNAARSGALEGYLENPGPNSFQSGIGVISGWVCEAAMVEIVLETAGGDTKRYVAAYGTERLDTARREDGTLLCGDVDNGFGLLFNWNLLGDGEHTVRALVDGVELGWATVQVTTVGEGEEKEFLQGVAGECVVEDFPMSGETVTLEWQQNSQNFVITALE